MSRYFRVDALIAQNKKIAGLPSDSARFAWIVLLGAAKFADPPGGWANEKHLKAALGSRARFVRDFLRVGLLEETEGRLLVHDWDRWQTDPTANDRQRRHRDKPVTLTGRHRDRSVTLNDSESDSDNESESDSVLTIVRTDAARAATL